MFIEGEQHFKQLFDDHYAQLCSIAFSIVKSHEIAEDIVQNFFLKVWHNRMQIDIVYSFKTYSSKAVYLLSLNQLRQNTRAVPLADMEEFPEIVSPSLDSKMIGAQEKEYMELMNAIEAVISQLPSKSQMIFKMAHYQQMRHAAIAEQLGISVNTVKVQMSRAYKTIRSQISKKDLPYFLLLFSPALF